MIGIYKSKLTGDTIFVYWVEQDFFGPGQDAAFYYDMDEENPHDCMSLQELSANFASQTIAVRTAAGVGG